MSGGPLWGEALTLAMVFLVWFLPARVVRLMARWLLLALVVVLAALTGCGSLPVPPSVEKLRRTQTAAVVVEATPNLEAGTGQTYFYFGLYAACYSHYQAAPTPAPASAIEMQCNQEIRDLRDMGVFEWAAAGGVTGYRP